MNRYIALLRGINVGGKNKITMPKLKSAFERQGFLNVSTYINSGNVIFESEIADIGILKGLCEKLIADEFKLNIITAVILANDLILALKHKPSWWNEDLTAKNNAIFVISPKTAVEIVEEIEDAKPEYEKIAFYGNIIFWTAPLETFSRTRLTAIVHKKEYNAITVRNANTTIKLAELVSKQ